jgi:hypothetical protein
VILILFLAVRTHTTEVCLVVQQLATNRQLALKVLAFIIVRKSSSSVVAGLRGAGLIVVTEKCENNSEIDSGHKGTGFVANASIMIFFFLVLVIPFEGHIRNLH